MGTCYSTGNSALFVPSPIPETFQEWQAIGLLSILRFHAFLQICLKDMKSSKHNIILQYNVIDKNGLQIGEVCETVETLKQISADVKQRKGGTSMIDDVNVCRLVSFLINNRNILETAIGNGELKPPYATLSHQDIFTLSPELRVSDKNTIIRFSLQVIKKSSIPDNNFLTEDALERWMNKRHDGIGDSIFFHMFFRCVRDIWPREEEVCLTIAEFIQCIDRFCSFDDDQLLAFCFFCLCRIGTKSGEIPFLAFSSLGRIFPEIRFARKERGHPSRSLVEEIDLRLKAIKADKSKRANDMRLLKQKAHLSELENGNTFISSSSITDNSDDNDDDDNWGDAVDKRKKLTKAGLSTGVDDLMCLTEFADMKEKSPFSVFDMIKIRDCLRKNILGETYWLNRERSVKNMRLNNLQYFGYDVRSQKLHVPLAVRYALQFGTSTNILRTPSMD